MPMTIVVKIMTKILIIALQQVWARGRDWDLFDDVEDANDDHAEEDDD